eukprot:363543-Chlamydomonas_euryale.AAC.2
MHLQGLVSPHPAPWVTSGALLRSLKTCKHCISSASPLPKPLLGFVEFRPRYTVTVTATLASWSLGPPTLLLLLLHWLFCNIFTPSATTIRNHCK